MRWPWFKVFAVVAEEDQVAFQTGSGFLDKTGIMYRPDGAEPVYRGNPYGSCRYEHLYGPWWRFHDLGD